jgi:tetratricopeptide (TPR) repeat protein
MRRYEEQLEHLRIAEQLDPLSAVVVYNEGLVLGLLGRKEEAWGMSGRLSNLDPGSVRAVTFRSFCYDVVDGNPKQALEELEKHPELQNEMGMMMSLAVESASAGDREAALRWLEKMLASPDPESFKMGSVAFVHLTLRDYGQFFAWANKAVDRKVMEFVDIELFPDMRPILSDPRWKALLKRANLDKTG